MILGDELFVKTKQNVIPKRYINLYHPILRFKRSLQINQVFISLDDTELIKGIFLLYFATFVVRSLLDYEELEDDSSHWLRELIESVYETDSFELASDDKSKIISYIDKFAKLLNTTDSLRVAYKIYEGYLDSAIYLILCDKPICKYRHYIDALILSILG